MAPKLIRSFLLVTSLAAAVAVYPPSAAHADDVLTGSALPTLPVFTSYLTDGETGVLRGVYVPNILADGVVQQPADDGNFVSTQQGYITQFAAASTLGSTGLLAHNFLAGSSFPELQVGTLVYLVYGDGTTAAYIVKQTLQYQALQPESPYSQFVDLSNGNSMSSSQVFKAAYGRPGAVVFQTCIANGGVPSWGRLFIVAEPYAYDYAGIFGIHRQ